MELTDKDLHCIARHIQEFCIDNEDYSPCQYCKYAIPCAEHNERLSQEEGRVLVYFYDKLIPILEKMTGTKILRFRRPDADCLAGSWIEEYPELLEAVTRIPFEERQVILRNPDILAYVHNPTTDNLQKLFPHQEVGI